MGSYKVFVIPLLCGIFAQVLKVIFTYFRERRIDFRRFIEPGGMPSAHAAAVASLSSAVGIQEGMVSPLFGVTLFFSLVIMYEAAGVRRAAGRQAEVLNRIIDELFAERRIPPTHLRELLGHTSIEVLVGALMGITITLLFY
ncbi:divergent PAP2 family protein [candidate division TA06 bacterium]|nr:divergent PAP2 family protein [candidate division TA06 bacterium]